MRHLALRLDAALASLEGGLVAALIVVAVLLNVTLVAGRLFFSYSANWMEELSVYAIIWMVFLGAVHVDRQGQHINVDILHHMVSAAARERLARIADVLQAVVCLGLAYLTLRTVRFTYQLGEVSLSSLEAPVWILMAVMPPSFLILGARSALRAARLYPESESGAAPHAETPLEARAAHGAGGRSRSGDSTR